MVSKRWFPDEKKRLIPSGAKCSRRTRRSNSCQILWLSALLLTTWRPAIRHWALCTANITWFRAVLRIIFRRRSRTAISPFTPASSDRKIRVLKFRYARTKCTKSAKKAWLRTGPINRGKKPKARISAGYASCWRFWNRHRIPKSFWRTPNWKCIMTRCSVLRRRAILSVCRSIQRRSILPMRCIRRSAIPVSARKSTAKSVRCGPFCKTATRWKF